MISKIDGPLMATSTETRQKIYLIFDDFELYRSGNFNCGFTYIIKSAKRGLSGKYENTVCDTTLLGVLNKFLARYPQYKATKPMKHMSDIQLVLNKLESLEAIAAGLKEHGITAPLKLTSLINEINEALEAVLVFNESYEKSEDSE